jgi:uncharacterized protein YegP (UPF0339 family)
MKSLRITVFRGDDGQWYCRMRSANGQTTWQTEGYSLKRGAERAARNMAAAINLGNTQCEVHTEGAVS